RQRGWVVAGVAVNLVAALGAYHWPDIARSKLYDPGFGHRFRKASATAATAAPADADTTATDTGLPTGEPT
ncbi:MAG TPA: hypothetical protein PLL04_02280, partial [Thauera sp.]|nr:hypothetical protein [Thauera sp.]